MVTSGGMYSQRLRDDDPEYLKGEYAPTTAYARSKRAQIELLPVLDDRWGAPGITVHATHPGWADTPGVVDSLPTFHQRAGAAAAGRRGRRRDHRVARRDPAGARPEVSSGTTAARDPPTCCAAPGRVAPSATVSGPGSASSSAWTDPRGQGSARAAMARLGQTVRRSVRSWSDLPVRRRSRPRVKDGPTPDPLESACAPWPAVRSSSPCCCRSRARCSRPCPSAPPRPPSAGTPNHPRCGSARSTFAPRSA